MMPSYNSRWATPDDREFTPPGWESEERKFEYLMAGNEDDRAVRWGASGAAVIETVRPEFKKRWT
jgi:hypothetical protein